MKNWRTTLFGCLGAVGVFLAKNSNPILAVIGEIVTIASPVLLGAAAKDAASN